MNDSPPPNGPVNLPTRHAIRRLKEALEDRLRPSEAIAVVAELLSQFPNAKVEDGFIRALSEHLAKQPRCVAERIAHPLGGVARQTEFLSVKRVVDWCERQAAPLHEELARLTRRVEQIEQGLDWRAPKPQSLLDAGKAWLERSDPVSQKVTAEGRRLHRELTEVDLERAAEQFRKRKADIEAEWAHEGRDVPTIGRTPISRELYELIKRNRAASGPHGSEGVDKGS